MGPTELTLKEQLSIPLQIMGKHAHTLAHTENILTTACTLLQVFVPVCVFFHVQMVQPEKHIKQNIQKYSAIRSSPHSS